MKITADVKSVSKLKEYFFVVPNYQREYVWKVKDQVERFLIDIENEFDPAVIDQKSYFIGSIIIVKNLDKYEVIDGQQRLTTIILALCGFRDILKPLILNLSLNQKKILQNIEELLSDYDINTDKVILRLELQYEESKDFITELIEKPPYKGEITPSIKRMDAAYLCLKSRFQEYIDNSLDGFINYIKFFLTKIDIVVIESENLSSALKIFETINQRGAGLNAMDLVKNLLFAKAVESDFEKIKDTWKEINQNLQKCGEDGNPLRFLRYFLMARYYSGVIREDDLYNWIISEEGKQAVNYELQPLQFAKELKKISDRYANLVIATELMKDGGDYPSITNVGFINKYKSRQHLILLLALDINSTNEDINYLGTQIESFFFYSNALGIQAKNNERLFAKWAENIRGISNINDLKNIISLTMLSYLKEKIGQFKTDFLNLRHYSFNPLYRQRYMLGKIENTILQLAGLPLNGKNFYDTLQIEHILPQTSKNDFLPNEFEDRDDYNSFLFKLGNVILLESTINQAVNNFNDLASDWFNKKKEEYVKSNITSTKLLDENFTIGQNTALNRFKTNYQYSFATWDKEAIKKRQSILLDLVFETWKINGQRIDR